MFNLNKVPALEAPDMVQDFGPAGTVARAPIRANAGANETSTGVGISNSDVYARQRTFAPSDLASLYKMVQELPNYHPSMNHVVARSRISGKRPISGTSAFPGPAGCVKNYTTALRQSAGPSHFATSVPTPATPPAGRTRAPTRIPTRAPALAVNPLLQHGRVADVLQPAGVPFTAESRNQAIGQSTTDIDAMDYYHDVSDGESDCGVSRINESQPGSSRVRLVERESSPTGCAKQLAPKLDDHADSSRQGGLLNSLQVDPATVTASVWKAKKLQSLSAGKVVPLTEEKKKREMEFNAAFNFNTERCTPEARCRSCSAFFEIPSPVGAKSTVDDSDPPPVLTNLDEVEAARKKGARHGPKSRSCEYRGVTFYKRTGRWEAHIWHDAAQVYLGTSATKEEAARAYDKAALMLGGPDADINFKLESHQLEMTYIYKLSKEQFVIYVRRDMRGYGAQLIYPGVKHVHNGYQAVYGIILLGTFPTEEEAARAIYRRAVRNSCGAMANWIIDTHHVRNMPSYAAQRFAAVHPEAVEAMRSLRNQTKASSSKLISMTEKQKEKSPLEEKLTTPSKTRNSSTSSRTASSSAAAAEQQQQQQQPVIQINDDVPPAADSQRISRTWGPHLAQSRCYRRSTCCTVHRMQHLTSQTPKPALPNNSRPRQSDVNTPAPHYTWPTQLFPVPAAPNPPATPAPPCRANQSEFRRRAGPPSSTLHRIPSMPGSVEALQGTKQLTSTDKSAPGTITFKLFNVEITVTEPALGDSNNIPPESHIPNAESGELYISPEEDRVIDYDLDLPRKRCKVMGSRGEGRAFASAPASAQLTPGLIDVVSINNPLHPILAGTEPSRHETGLARVLLRPALQTAGLALDRPGLRADAETSPAGFAKYRKPRCTCTLCR